MKLYDSKKKINRGRKYTEQRKKELGNYYKELLKYLANCQVDSLGIVKKTSSVYAKDYEKPSRYTKDELEEKIIDFIFDSPFNLLEMDIDEIINLFNVKTYGTDVLVELAIDIKLNLISQEQFDLVFDCLIQKYYSLSSEMKNKNLLLIDTELKNKKRFKRTIFIDDYDANQDKYFRFNNGLVEIIDIIIKSGFLTVDRIEELEEIKFKCLDLLDEKVKKL